MKVDDIMPEESNIINDDIAYMGQDPEKVANAGDDLLDDNQDPFKSGNQGFLESNPNIGMLTSKVSGKDDMGGFLLDESNTNNLGNDLDLGNEDKDENVNKGFGGFLSDDENKGGHLYI